MVIRIILWGGKHVGHNYDTQKDIGELEKDKHLTSAGTLFSLQSRSSDWEHDFTSVLYHLGNVVINLALCVPFVALLLLCCGNLELNPGPTPFIQKR